MRGPSSSHTAAAHRIGSVIRELHGSIPQRLTVRLDAQGSYAATFKEQGAEMALAAGLLGIPMTDGRFFDAIELLSKAGCKLEVEHVHLPRLLHPNWVSAIADSGGGQVTKGEFWSVGGGLVRLVNINGWQLDFYGDGFEYLIEMPSEGTCAKIVDAFLSEIKLLHEARWMRREGGRLACAFSTFEPVLDGLMERLKDQRQYVRFWCVSPAGFVPRGRAIWNTVTELKSEAERTGLSLGRLAVLREAELLALTPEKVLEELGKRYAVMLQSIENGLRADRPRPVLVERCATKLAEAANKGRLLVGKGWEIAYARAMAVMHEAATMGVICAAPTGGSAGVLPALFSTAGEVLGASTDLLLHGLAAAGLVGVLIGQGVGFAAEDAGCQVEIGAAQAMGAAGLVELVGGTCSQALDAAAVSLQNTMGLVCDLVDGRVEIPCHTRNAAAVLEAIVAADLVIGGYSCPIGLEATIEAVRDVGCRMPAELRCTGRGGLGFVHKGLRER